MTERIPALDTPDYVREMGSRYGVDALDDCARIWLSHEEADAPTIEGGMVLLDKLNAVFSVYDVADDDRADFALAGLYRYTMHGFQQQEETLRPHFEETL